MTDVKLTAAEIAALRHDLNESLSQFGLTLKRAIDPRATTGYTRQYISRLEHGLDPITPEIQAAFYNIAGALDDVTPGISGLISIKVLAMPGQLKDGAVVPRTAVMVKCARPGCPVWFIQTNPSQRYHDIECRPRRSHKKRA